MAKVGVFVGTMYGHSLMVAENAKAILVEKGHQTSIYDNPALADWIKYKSSYALLITSTTGQGDLPDNIITLFQTIKETLVSQSDIHYGIIALGDSSYANFCGGGKQFDLMLQKKNARRVGEILFIDADRHPKPEDVSNSWVSYWETLLH